MRDGITKFGNRGFFSGFDLDIALSGMGSGINPLSSYLHCPTILSFSREL
ncbi:MAG: hypothetical protein ACR2F1_08140 [Nitrososphaeraceae archaeon]